MYALHFLLPFMVAGCVVVHLGLLHIMGSGSASTAPGSTVDGEAFILYYYKDAWLLAILSMGSHDISCGTRTLTAHCHAGPGGSAL